MQTVSFSFQMTVWSLALTCVAAVPVAAGNACAKGPQLHAPDACTYTYVPQRALGARRDTRKAKASRSAALPVLWPRPLPCSQRLSCKGREGESKYRCTKVKRHAPLEKHFAFRRVKFTFYDGHHSPTYCRVPDRRGFTSLGVAFSPQVTKIVTERAEAPATNRKSCKQAGRMQEAHVPEAV
jgi:hypothetical protein